MTQKNSPILFTTKRPPIIFEKGEGMILWDTTGKAYLDFIGGWAVNSLGHCHSGLAEVIAKQAKTLINASPQFENKPMLEFAEALTKAADLEKVFFCSSGAEANESAIKCARKWGQKEKQGAYEIITFKHSFHGRTLATMSASGKEAFKPLFEPKVSGFKHAEWNDISSVKSLVTPQTCAIMFEPIQGEGGVHPIDEQFIKELKKLAENEKLLLIFDEIQTGIGRTGTLFCYEQFGVKPDIMTLGKGIGSGYPLAAMLCQQYLDIFEPGDQGGTYTAQPLGMAVGLYVLEQVNKPEFLLNVQKCGDLIKEKLEALSNIVKIKNIRGKGLLIGADFPEINTVDIVQKCLEKGFILNAPGLHTLRFIPPLIVTESAIEKGFSILEDVLKN